MGGGEGGRGIVQAGATVALVDVGRGDVPILEGEGSVEQWQEVPCVQLTSMNSFVVTGKVLG